MCWSQNSYVLEEIALCAFMLLAFSLMVFVCLFFPLSSSQVSVLNLMLLGLCAWRNNRNWKIAERMKCKNINLRRALTMKKVLRRGWKLVWIYLTKMYGALRYCASELQQRQDIGSICCHTNGNGLSFHYVVYYSPVCFHGPRKLFFYHFLLLISMKKYLDGKFFQAGIISLLPDTVGLLSHDCRH